MSMVELSSRREDKAKEGGAGENSLSKVSVPKGCLIKEGLICSPSAWLHRGLSRINGAEEVPQGKSGQTLPVGSGPSQAP